MRMLSFLLKKRTQKGFALVELVIVIAVFAILVAIAIPVVSTILTDARSIYEQVAIDVERNNQEKSTWPGPALISIRRSLTAAAARPAGSITTMAIGSK